MFYSYVLGDSTAGLPKQLPSWRCGDIQPHRIRSPSLSHFSSLILAEWSGFHSHLFLHIHHLWIRPFQEASTMQTTQPDLDNTTMGCNTETLTGLSWLWRFLLRKHRLLCWYNLCDDPQAGRVPLHLPHGHHCLLLRHDGRSSCPPRCECGSQVDWKAFNALILLWAAIHRECNGI